MAHGPTRTEGYRHGDLCDLEVDYRTKVKPILSSTQSKDRASVMVKFYLQWLPNMLLKSTISLLLAALAAAVPSKRQAWPTIGISLTNKLWDVTENVTAPTNGTSVTVNAKHPFDLVTLKCLEDCDEPKRFYCVFYDKGPTVVFTLLPGNNDVGPAQRNGSFMCAPDLPDPPDPEQGDVDNIGPMSYLWLKLTNTTLNETQWFDADGNGTAVPIDTNYAFDQAYLECVGLLCVPEFHCTIHDENLSPIVTLGPGNTEINLGKQRGSITCGPGMPPTPRPALEARATKPTIHGWLTNSILHESKEFRASMNGSAVYVEMKYGFDYITKVGCLEGCDQLERYYCIYDDKDLDCIATLLPGHTVLSPPNIADPLPHRGVIKCRPGYPPIKLAAMAARATKPYDGAAIFADKETG